MQIAGRVWLQSGGQAAAILGGVFVLGSIAVFIWGCMSYARGKGQSPSLGFLKHLSIIGLVVLALVPEKHKNS